MKILQVLPSLDSGGVERGTVDFARELVRRGHQSMVMSNGGRMVAQLEEEGSWHIPFAVHKKSPSSLLRISALKRTIERLAPDIVHVRSRIPAWMVWLAFGRQRPAQRPAIVSTFHGLYSVSRYSAIMGCGDRVIAISACVRDYILANYRGISSDKITVIHRGVDTAQFPQMSGPDAEWRMQFFVANPQVPDVPLLLMPGRLSRWKGQMTFLQLMASLQAQGVDCHGLVVGEPDPGKQAYVRELEETVARLGLSDRVTFLGHRSDMAQLYALASVVFNLSEHPEPFGRTVIEALATGAPVIAWNEGGPAESLHECLPQGLAPPGDMDALVAATLSFLEEPPQVSLAPAFTLQAQADATLAVYRQALDITGKPVAVSPAG